MKIELKYVFSTLFQKFSNKLNFEKKVSHFLGPISLLCRFFSYMFCSLRLNFILLVWTQPEWEQFFNVNIFLANISHLYSIKNTSLSSNHRGPKRSTRYLFHYWQHSYSPITLQANFIILPMRISVVSKLTFLIPKKLYSKHQIDKSGQSRDQTLLLRDPILESFGKLIPLRPIKPRWFEVFPERNSARIYFLQVTFQ